MPSINHDLEVEKKSELLLGKTIAYGVSGSIAAVESVKAIRELRRHGAQVMVFSTISSFQFVGKTALEWASAKPVHSQLSSAAEHIHAVDALVIAPATLNLLNKIAAGLADDPLTTLFQSLLSRVSSGGIPALVFPAMHSSLGGNPILKSSMEKLISWGVKIFTGLAEEGKHKIPDPEFITAQVLNNINSVSGALGFNDHGGSRGKGGSNKIFITTGAVPSFIDEIRTISNNATGKTGVSLAKEFYYRGCDVSLLASSNLKEVVPNFLSEVEYYTDFFEYETKANQIIKREEGRLKGAIFLAAVSDFSPVNKLSGKVNSKKNLNLALQPNPKVIAKLKEKFPKVRFVIFKLETNLSQKEIDQIGKTLKQNYEVVVVNLKEELGSFKKYVFFKEKKVIARSVAALAEALLENIPE